MIKVAMIVAANKNTKTNIGQIIANNPEKKIHFVKPQKIFSLFASIFVVDEEKLDGSIKIKKENKNKKTKKQKR